MSNSVVYGGQSFFNKVVENTGDIDNAFQMMLTNKRRSLTDNVSVGIVLKASKITDYDVLDFFSEQNRPATLNNRTKSIDASEWMFPGEFPFSF